MLSLNDTLHAQRKQCSSLYSEPLYVISLAQIDSVYNTETSVLFHKLYFFRKRGYLKEIRFR